MTLGDSLKQNAAGDKPTTLAYSAYSCELFILWYRFRLSFYRDTECNLKGAEEGISGMKDKLVDGTHVLCFRTTCTCLW
jgi:hypothetical protein